MHNDEKPLVSICCITYNHGKFIADCLNGFLKQKTSFLFEIVISNDCSTDDTKTIIDSYMNQYPKMIKNVSPKENQGMMKNFYSTLMKCKGKYVAYCEGDDYWIDENKLQMQVDFLENNPDYGLCYTKAKQYNQNEQKFNKKSIGADFDGFEDLLKNGNRIPTLTTVYRKDLLDKYQKEIQPGNKGWLMGDYPMWLYFSHESKVKFFDKTTAVYRVLEESASHSVDVEKKIRFVESYYEIIKCFSQKYESPNKSWDENEHRFNIIYYRLLTRYNKKDAKILKSLTNNSARKKVIAFFSNNIFLWYVFKIILSIRGLYK